MVALLAARAYPKRRVHLVAGGIGSDPPFLEEKEREIKLNAEKLYSLSAPEERDRERVVARVGVSGSEGGEKKKDEGDEMTKRGHTGFYYYKVATVS